MGLVVVARYSVLGEAQVARTALESAGLFAVVMDEGLGALNYMWEQLLQGYRLCVVDEDLMPRRDVLMAARSEGAAAGPSDIVVEPRSAPWIVLSLFPWLPVDPRVGLLFEAARRKPTPARYVALAIFVTFALLLAGSFATALLSPEPAYGY
jgi:hypothetical protein